MALEKKISPVVLILKKVFILENESFNSIKYTIVCIFKLFYPNSNMYKKDYRNND